jgi:hypothetical protein
MKRLTTTLLVLSVGTSSLLVFPGVSPASAAPPPSSGSTTRECSLPTSGYGEMFAELPDHTWSTDDLRSLADAMIAPVDEPSVPDPEDNPAIPAMYTYFGQFIDHDITFDDRPNDLVTPTRPSDLVNARTPRLDLDSLYGSGPTASPTLYSPDGMHLLTGSPLTGSGDTGALDLPRDAGGSALIGDPRNDENRIVAGIHSLFIRFHNRTVDRVKSRNRRLTNAQVFERARREVVASYQWMVLTDYLPQIAGSRTVDDVVRRTGSRWRTNLRFYDSCDRMPIEFSVAAYRFGHSQVRATYRVNASVDPLPVFSGTFVPGSDLGGFSPSPSNLAIDWSLFLPTRPGTNGTAQSSYKIDGSLTHSLSLLPLPTTGVGPANLALRNLLRGQQLGLATGQDVARAMGVTPLPDDRILIGAATGDPNDQRTLVSISSSFAGSAPLWVYVLAEAAANPQVNRLGPVGGRLVVETIVGLMASDPGSVISRGGSRPPVDGLRGLVRAVV